MKVAGWLVFTLLALVVSGVIAFMAFLAGSGAALALTMLLSGTLISSAIFGVMVWAMPTDEIEGKK